MTIEETSMEPIPVRIVGEEQEQAAQFGAWTAYVFAGVAGDQAVPILPQDRKRKRAVVFVTGTAPAVAFFGSMAQAQQRMCPVPVGSVFAVESMSELWTNSNGANAVTVVVLMETYRSE